MFVASLGPGGGLFLVSLAATAAHLISGSVAWTDELLCLVPATLLFALVAVLSFGSPSRPVRKRRR
jgi:hypothetical protein